MARILENRYVQALMGLILFSAIIHMFLLAVYAVIDADVTYLNYFNIIDLDLIFPNIGMGGFSQIFSLLTAVVIYAGIYFMLPRAKE